MEYEKSKLISALYVVSTPIGNLEDITLRAIRVLKNSDYIICEDTRVTKKLLTYYDIKIANNHIILYNDHSDENTRNQIIDLLKAGHVISLVSDAGTPLISDPGYKLVKQIYENDLKVISIPGASSITAAISISGMPTNRFLFVGFLPPKQLAKQKILKELDNIYDTSIIIFETSKKIETTLNHMANILGNDRIVSVVREITKIYEEVKFDSVSNLIDYYKNHSYPKGEMVLILAPKEEKKGDVAEDDLDIMILNLLKSGNKTNQIAKILAEKTSYNKKDIYKKILLIKEQ